MKTLLYYFIIILISYFIGCISPANIVAKRKKTDLKQSGTGNLGATNTTIVLGKKYGIIVMIFDICKSILAIIFCTIMFPNLRLVIPLSGSMCIIGHIFPFYLNFKGGKGLAAFGGFVLMYNPRIFLMLLLIGVVFSFITDYSCCLPISAAALFPYTAFHYHQDIVETSIIGFLCLIILFKHRDNFMRAVTGKELTISRFFRDIYR